MPDGEKLDGTARQAADNHMTAQFDIDSVVPSVLSILVGANRAARCCGKFPGQSASSGHRACEGFRRPGQYRDRLRSDGRSLDTAYGRRLLRKVIADSGRCRGGLLHANTS
ncbi:hypothetical protein HPP92_018911 [Vanilla planifolia]|uniref:Uncharacterized protein n=1 Tax=Vanilla planifolia TaxID=51239 RepID=A0A835Q8I8_VANPL|nr:hypothetical protein HPP92_019484 [Vanilla planifolia]KAG0464747.1 hypothetical protein HPP92_018911 [Vanilla planifolia]